jgi:hypothetical protein
MKIYNFTCIVRRLLEGVHVTVKAELCTFCINVPYDELHLFKGCAIFF